MAEQGEKRGGALSSLGRILKTVLAVAHNRLELMLVELQEERWRFFNALLLAGLVLILAAMTLLVATVAIVIVCVKAERLDLVVWLTGIYLVGTLVGLWRLRSRLKNWAPLSATLAELKKDKECLEEKT
jgi:uncharacterized membrane protein YqjE